MKKEYKIKEKDRIINIQNIKNKWAQNPLNEPHRKNLSDTRSLILVTFLVTMLSDDAQVF